MAITKIGPKYQVTIPRVARDAAHLKIGDYIEVTGIEGKVIIKPKKVVDADDVLTPAQRAVIDKRLAEAEEDIKAGRMSGPFATADALKRHLNTQR